MGEALAWACKNGDLDQVKDVAGKPVRKTMHVHNNTSLSGFCGCADPNLWHRLLCKTSSLLKMGGIENSIDPILSD